MSRKAGLRIGAVVATVGVVLAVTASAVAAGGSAPRLLSPNHRRVNPGRIKLALYVPLPAASHGVFIKIQPNRKKVGGHLPISCNVSKRCEYVEAHHAKGHGRKYVFVASPGSFSGYWATTPGKYFWQAEYFTAHDLAHYYSGIGYFYVK